MTLLLDKPRRKTLLERWRVPITWVVLPAWLTFLVSTKAKGFETAIYETIELFGFFLIFTAVLGRLWCALYIGGRKDKELCRTGPYSLSRNPLYFFSFLGVLGICLAAQNLILMAVTAAVFLIYYRLIIEREEERLFKLFGDGFRAYVAEVPRFFPRWTKPAPQDEILVKTRAFTRAITEVAWFLMAIIGVEMIESLRLGAELSSWTLPY